MIASCSSCLLHPRSFRSPTPDLHPIPAEEPSELSHLPSPSTTARHNLATSFTRALSEPKPIAAHQQTPACARELASKRALHPIHNVKQPENRDQRTDVRHPLANRVLKFFFLQRSHAPDAGTKLGPTVLCLLFSVLWKLVEPNGIEPMTSCLQSRRSPS